MEEKIKKISEEFAEIIKEARFTVKQELDSHIRIVQGTDISLAEDYFANSVEYFKRATDQSLLKYLKNRKIENEKN